MDEAALLRLGAPKYKVACLPAPQQQHIINKQQQYQQQLAAAPDPDTAAQIREQHLIEQAVAAAAAFRAVAAEAAGMVSSSTSSADANGSSGTASDIPGPPYGPWRPFMAPIVTNQRVTAGHHFQDTRHIEFDLSGSGLQYEPGDLLSIFPRTPAADVEVRWGGGLEQGSMVREFYC